MHLVFTFSGPYNWDEVLYSLPTIEEHRVVVTNEALLREHLAMKQSQHAKKQLPQHPSPKLSNCEGATKEELDALIHHSLIQKNLSQMGHRSAA